MDNKTVILWVVGIVVRGIAWILAAKLGLDAVESKTLAAQVGEGLGALLIAAVSIYSSVKGRKVLLNTEPPVDVK